MVLRRSLLVPLALVVALIASAGLATWVYLYQARPGQETNGAVAAQTVKAASDGAVALLSYAPESMDKDFAAAKSHLTGDFLDYYSQFTHDIVTPAVQAEVGEDVGVDRAGGRVRTAARLGGGAGVPQPDHHQQGEPGRVLHRERREGRADEGRRRLADLVLRPGVADPYRRVA